ncbi:MAG: YlxR family protein [Leptolyngbya sp. BL-A-14]
MPPNYRRCVSCRKVAPKQEFWRVVRLHKASIQSTFTVQLDEGMGRSVYLCPQVNCLQLAQKKDRLARALKAPVTEQLYQILWQRLKSGQIVQSQDASTQGNSRSTIQ